MTQIQLEHTRKLTFIPDKKSGAMVPPGGADFGTVVGKELPANNEFGSKPPPHIRFKKYAFGL